MTHARAYSLLLLVTLIWAANYPLAKLALAEFDPITLAAARALFAVPVLVITMALMRERLPALGRRDYRTFLVLSLTGLVGNTVIWYWGLKYTNPVSAGILGASAPVIVALVGAVWLGDRLSRANYLGMVLTMLAVLLTITRGSFERLLALSFNRGDVLILVSQSVWVAYTLYSRANTSGLAPVTIQVGAHVISLAILAPLSLLERPWEALPRVTWVGWSVVAYSAGPITLGHLWYYLSVRTVGAGRAAVFMNLTPFVVIGLSWAMLGDAIRWYHAVGAIVVIAGVFFATRRAVSAGAA